MGFKTFYCVYKARVGDQGTWTRCSDAVFAATEAGKDIKWQDIEDDLQ